MIDEKREEKIKEHFKSIYKGKTYKQIFKFHRALIPLITEFIEYNGLYIYEGFEFHYQDIPLLNLILKENEQKMRILNNL